MQTFTVQDFVQRLASNQLGTQVMVEGMAKVDESKPNVLLFNPDNSCKEWLEIHRSSIAQVEFLGMVACQDHQHPRVRLSLNPPAEDNALAQIYHKLLQQIALRSGEPRTPCGGTLGTAVPLSLPPSSRALRPLTRGERGSLTAPVPNVVPPPCHGYQPCTRQSDGTWIRGYLTPGTGCQWVYYHCPQYSCEGLGDGSWRIYGQYLGSGDTVQVDYQIGEQGSPTRQSYTGTAPVQSDGTWSLIIPGDLLTLVYIVSVKSTLAPDEVIYAVNC